MDGLTPLADYTCCLDTPPRERCRIMEDNNRMARKDILLAGDSCGGKSIIEHIETQLDQVIRSLMEIAEHPAPEETVALWRGQAQGLCEALAIIRNPYLPNIVQIKAEAMMRYETGAIPEEFVNTEEKLVGDIEFAAQEKPDRLVHKDILTALVQAAPPKVQEAARTALGLDEDR